GRFPVHRRGRRRQVAGVVLGGGALASWNAVLTRVCPAVRPLEADQVASIGRRVLEASTGARCRFVAARMADLQLLARLRADPGWSLSEGLAPRIDALLAYARGPVRLIPDQVPALGHLDDAILVDLLRRDMAAELADYQDFCSYRLELAERCRVAPERIAVGIPDWIAARCDAVAARRAERARGFAPAPVPARFRVV